MYAVIKLRLRIAMLVLMAAVVMGKWSPAKKPEKEEHTEIGGVGTDSSTNTTYIQYIYGDIHTTHNWYLGVNILLPNGEFGHHFLLYIRNGVFGTEICSFDNGKNLVSVIHALRSPPTSSCNYWVMGGCTELSIRESSDAGHSWTPAVLIQRTKMNDAAHRLTPTVVYIKETSRVFIFYFMIHYEKAKNAVGLVTRPAGSSTYSMEKMLFLTGEGVGGVSAAYTLENGTPILQLIWTINIHMIMHSRSRDNGLSWSHERNIASGFDNGLYYHSTTLLASPNAEPNTLYLYYLGRDYVSYVMWSLDGGVTWGSSVPMSHGHTTMGAAKICGTSRGGVVVTLSVVNEHYLEFAYLNTRTKKASFGEPAFADVDAQLYVPYLACIPDPNDARHFSVKAAATTTTQRDSYVSTYELWLDV